MFAEVTSFHVFGNKTACRSGKWCYSKQPALNKYIQDDITKTLEIQEARGYKVVEAFISPEIAWKSELHTESASI
jgi:hypothetical protein